MTGKPNNPENTRVLKFDDLTVRELHDILKLRVDIFVVEQTCVYPEIDGKDPICYHVITTDEHGEIIGTARIAPAGVVYTEWSIGRVALIEYCRKRGLGIGLMETALAFCDRQGVKSIKIAAQTYLEKFYSDLGFFRIGEPYLWDGIMHVDMRKTGDGRR